MHPLRQHFSKVVEFTDQEFEQCLNHFNLEKYKRKDLVIQAGELVSQQYFVVQGCLRTYLLDQNVKEHTVQFAVEDWWASDYIAYYTGDKSTLYVECIEDCELLSIRKIDLEKLFLQVPALEHFFLRQLENAFVAFQKRILSNLQSSAEERYDLFVSNYPNIEQRVKNYQIASFLGITPESLSRIRKTRARH